MGDFDESLGAVQSADGTTIGYLRIGSGPALVLVHGAMQSSSSFSRLARLLAPDFTVFSVDRRGRGLSGPAGPDYGLDREIEDLDAVLKHSGATRLFGLSAGALISLATVQRRGGVEKLALYEPPLLTRSGVSPLFWAARYERDLAAGDLGAAMASIMKGTGDKSLFTALPRFLMVPLLRAGLKREAADSASDTVRVADLIPTVRNDIKMPTQVGPADRYGKLTAKVLLLGGSTSQDYLRIALDELSAVLPEAERIEYPGQGHIAADDNGKPEIVAPTLRRFFAA